jgi:maleate isomerase
LNSSDLLKKTPATGMYGRRARIGYTSPPLTTEVFPYEFYKMVPDGVSLVITTLAITDRSKEEVDQSYDISMKAAREMAAAGCDLIMLGGVPINLSRGYENADKMIDDLEAELGVKVSTSASAQKKVFKLLSSKKMVVAHPYEKKDNWRFTEYGTKFGSEVLDVLEWGSPFNQIGRIPREAALELGRKVLKKNPDADTMMFPSPHWPVIDAIAPLEEEFGVTVLSSIQIIIWDALRRTGIDDKFDGFGRLFKEF